MKAWLESLRSLAGSLICPGQIFAHLEATNGGKTFVVVSLWIASLAWCQSLVLLPLLQADPMFQAPESGPAGESQWLGLLIVILAPMGLGFRVGLMASILSLASLMAGFAARWRKCMHLVLHLEVVFLLESSLYLLWFLYEPPAANQSLHDLRLRTGLDLVWQPGTPVLRAFVSSVSLFEIWWGYLLYLGLSRALRLPLAGALGLWVALFSLDVGSRMFMHYFGNP